MADPRRRTFGPVVLVGLASAGLAAVAGNRHWVEWSAQSRGESSLLTLTGDGTATVPLAGALALVLLACWGVLLVTRGRLRRAVAVLALVVSAGMVATAVLGYRSAAQGCEPTSPTSGSRTRACSRSCGTGCSWRPRSSRWSRPARPCAWRRPGPDGQPLSKTNRNRRPKKKKKKKKKKKNIANCCDERVRTLARRLLLTGFVTDLRTAVTSAAS